MTQPEGNAPGLSLTINGSKLAVGLRPDLSELEPALRSVALSDSPIVVRAPREDHPHLLRRLHALGRRARLPVHECRCAEEAEPLLAGLSTKPETSPSALGTWALFEVESWPEDRQRALGDLLEALDLGRLHGRLRHERIPRVVMFSTHERPPRVLPSLDLRISYFTLVAVPTNPQEK